MSRSVIALYDTRAEAEVARARLFSQVRTEQVQILARSDASKLDQMELSAQDARTYREALDEGSVLLIAEVASSEDGERIVGLLQEAAAGAADPERLGQRLDNAVPGSAVVDEVRIPQAQEALRIGKREVVQGGAKVRSFTREQPVHEDVRLREEQIEAETRPGGRQLTLEEVQAAGLLKDRVVEVSAMREEPVITKNAVVREEVVLKKVISERVETIHETLRHTEVEVEELPGDRSARESSVPRGLRGIPQTR
jgi:stress response protein YsnF